MKARYLNVDLELESDSDLTPFISFLEGKVLFLWKEITSNQSSIGLETNLLFAPGPEENIAEFLNIIETLPPDLRHLWFNSGKKVIDIGYECGSMEDPINSFISSGIVQRLAQLGCSINITIYPCVEAPEEEGEEGTESDTECCK